MASRYEAKSLGFSIRPYAALRNIGKGYWISDPAMYSNLFTKTKYSQQLFTHEKASKIITLNVKIDSVLQHFISLLCQNNNNDTHNKKIL